MFQIMAGKVLEVEAPLWSSFQKLRRVVYGAGNITNREEKCFNFILQHHSRKWWTIEKKCYISSSLFLFSMLWNFATKFLTGKKCSLLLLCYFSFNSISSRKHSTLNICTRALRKKCCALTLVFFSSAQTSLFENFLLENSPSLQLFWRKNKFRVGSSLYRKLFFFQSLAKKQ